MPSEEMSLLTCPCFYWTTIHTIQPQQQNCSHLSYAQNATNLHPYTQNQHCIQCCALSTSVSVAVSTSDRSSVLENPPPKIGFIKSFSRRCMRVSPPLPPRCRLCVYWSPPSPPTSKRLNPLVEPELLEVEATATSGPTRACCCKTEIN